MVGNHCRALLQSLKKSNPSIGTLVYNVTPRVPWDTVPLPNERPMKQFPRFNNDGIYTYKGIINESLTSTGLVVPDLSNKKSRYEQEPLAVILMQHEYHNQLTLLITQIK